MNFSVSYQQADSTAVDIRDYVYRSGTEVVNFGSPSSALGATYTNAEDMISNTGKTVFLRHKIKNGVITVSEVGFIYEGNESRRPRITFIYTFETGEVNLDIKVAYANLDG